MSRVPSSVPVDPAAPPAGADAAGVVLELANIDKRFPGVHALQDVSFSVRAGEVHALVGENGAGKSTLVGIAAGRLLADSGSIELDSEVLPGGDPEQARERGLAIVYQEPALLPDLTVAENMRIGMPEHRRPAASEQNAWATQQLSSWAEIVPVSATAYVRELRPDARFLVEICRALAEVPRVLILDEPTEHLDQDGVQQLFHRIDELAQRGCAIVYISHRIREVKQVADTVTVLRDGAKVGSFVASEVEEDEIINLIVGRALETRFPPKADPADVGDVQLELSDFTGSGFSSVDMSIRSGEIVGLGGIDGHGQRETLRALAGLTGSTGSVSLGGRRVALRGPVSASRNGLAYLSNDRHSEGMFDGLNVRENLTVKALGRLSRGGVLLPRFERRAATAEVRAYGIRTPSTETPIGSLSGGNQQKAMLSRVLMARPAVILADEPTQGVDVGARAEIYSTLRRATDSGSSVLVVSSDASELEGLCDRVLIFSRGNIVGEISGEDVSERNITETALTATAERRRSLAASGWRHRIGRFAQGDIAPSSVLAIAIVILGLVATQHSPFYLTQRNFTLLLPLFAALAFIAIGQQFLMLIGSIDLSVGPLTGFIVVVASFLLSDGGSAIGHLPGWLAIAGVAIGVAFINWFLITITNIPPLIGTLVTYMGLQGLSLVLRPTPGGTISTSITDTISTNVSFVPVAAIVAVVLAVALEFGLYRTLTGVRVRALGSYPSVARQIGIRAKRVSFYAYVACSGFAFLGALLLMAQVGSGNAQAGIDYTLSSIAAVVLGGASIFGGRGSFVGALLGAALIVQVDVVVQFLGLDAVWQQYFLGGLTIAAASLYSTARARSARDG